MPLPVPLPIVPPPMMLHSEDEVEPAYATGTSAYANIDVVLEYICLVLNAFYFGEENFYFIFI